MTKLTTLRKEHQWKRYALYLFGLLVAIFVLILLAAKILSYGAAQVFNYAVTRQDMLRGTITVETITANIHGGVTFTNLSWDDPDGDPVLRVPEGSFKVNPWDILRGHFASTTVKELTLIKPAFAVEFDEDMNVDFVNRKLERKEKKEEKEDDDGGIRNLEKKVSNFNRSGRPIKAKLNLIDARMEAFYLQRHYIVSHVNLSSEIDTKGMTRLDLKTGSFGGTAVGEGADLSCEINFKEKGLPAIIDFTAKGVDPASLGLGDDIHDKMTLTVHGGGPISHPIGDGQLSMDELHIPALDFSKVTGNIHYDGGLMTFKDVHARVYGGTVDAYGDYNIDTRAYNIYLSGEGLDSRIPSKEPKFYCLVKLDGEIHCDGDPKHLRAFGKFSTGNGFYMLVPFNSIRGTFNNRYRAVDVYDVSIDTNFGIIRTDAFHIIDGKLHLGNIELVDKDTGKVMSLKEAANNEGPMKTIKKIQENVKSIKEQVAELRP